MDPLTPYQPPPMAFPTYLKRKVQPEPEVCPEKLGLTEDPPAVIHGGGRGVMRNGGGMEEG